MMSKKLHNIKIAYIGGGSRGWAWGFMKDLANDGSLGGEVRLFDIDIAAARANEIIGAKINAHPDAKSQWQYVTAVTRDEALTDADFVVISILPGTFDEMESDVHLPEQYGIYQSVGDTVGPGGLVRSLRTIPMMVEIARDIARFSPKAWVINYTNPMTLCIRTLYDTFPEIRAFGCCHEVFGTQKMLASMVATETGHEEIPREEIRTTVLGINHFTWLTEASYKGYDLFPMYGEYVERYYETGYTGGEDNNWMNTSFHCANRVKFDLYRRYGSIAAAGDRHLAEFMPPWYLKDPATVEHWKFGLTKVAWRREELKGRLARSKRLLSGDEEIDLKPSGEEGLLLIRALLGLGDLISNVNIPNRGQIPNLPIDAVVETNALFHRDGIVPLMAGAVPDSILPLVHRHVCNQENTLTAAKTCDFPLALCTFLHDPLVTLNPHEAEKLLRHMLYNTLRYLPEGWRKYAVES